MFFKKKKKYPTTTVTSENYHELVINSDVPVLLDFWAPWCGPCKIVGPIIDELAEEFEGRALVAKVNTEQQQELAAKFKIKSIPTLVFIVDKMIVERFAGAIPKPNLEEILEELIEEQKTAKEAL